MGIVNSGVLWDDMPHSAPAPNSGPSALHLQGKVSTTTPGKTGAMTGDVRPHRRRRGGLAASDADRSVRLVQLGPCSPGTGRQKVHGTRPSLQFDPSRLLVGPSRPASFLSVLFSGCGRFSSRSDLNRALTCPEAVQLIQLTEVTASSKLMFVCLGIDHFHSLPTYKTEWFGTSHFPSKNSHKLRTNNHFLDNVKCHMFHDISHEISPEIVVIHL